MHKFFENAIQVAIDHKADIIEWLIKESGSIVMKASFETDLAIQAEKCDDLTIECSRFNTSNAKWKIQFGKASATRCSWCDFTF